MEGRKTPARRRIEHGALIPIARTRAGAAAGDQIDVGELKTLLTPALKIGNTITVEDAHAKEAALKAALMSIQADVYWYSVREP
jgi:hypothetical protein